MNIVAFSGGKDSTALALRMHELGEDFELLFTPTDNELPEVRQHCEAIAARLGKTIIYPEGPKLVPLIRSIGMLPNNRARWCTRKIKIEPCIAWLLKHPGSTLCVGLRADEEEREGLYGPYATYRFPLREYGWGIDDVWGYLNQLGIKVPPRTDCAFCYDQRLSDWYWLWKLHPEVWAFGEQLEAETTAHRGYECTFRSPMRDTWPASMKGLREEFEKGRVPRGIDLQMDLDKRGDACRVCRL